MNTAIDELDTVRAVSNPSRIVQTQGASYMFTDSDAKVVRIDDAVPVDLDAEGLRDAASAPPGTEEVDTSGDFVAYRTDAGAISAGRLSSGQVTPLDPTGTRSSEGADGPAYTSDAIAVDATGELFSYSAAAGTVVRMDIDTGEVRGTDSVAADVSAPALTAAGDDWVLVDTASGDYWTVRRTGVSAGTSGVVALSRADADADGDAVYLADESGLVRVPTTDAAAERVFGDRTTSRGTPARPVVRGGVVYAAWLSEGAGPGTLWTSAGGDVRLDYAGATLPSQRRPTFTDAGDGLVLNDTRSGWVWTVPDGAIVPSSQNWDLDDAVEIAPETNEQEPPAVIDPRPPASEVPPMITAAIALSSNPTPRIGLAIDSRVT